jgi:2',3'-cyclic-nucleotide 2'-phosphodiesterase (5'-nucleotidase family)
MMATTTDLVFLHFNDVVRLKPPLLVQLPLYPSLCFPQSLFLPYQLTNLQYHISNPTLIANFLTKLRSWRAEHAHSKPYTIFSGDVFSPSLEASILRGDHMIALLDEFEIDLGCFGNHGKLRSRYRPEEGECKLLHTNVSILRTDFDFGEQRLRELKEKTRIEWLLSNTMSSNRGEKEQGKLNGSVLDETGRLRESELLAGAKMWHTAVLQGYKVGFLGLAGR